MKSIKMTTVSQIIIFVGLLIVAIGGLMYYIYSSRDSDEKHTQLIQNDTALEQNIKNIKEDVLSNQDTNFNKLNKEVKKIDTSMSKIKKTKPSVNIENSPNSVVQINEKGDNIINKPIEEYKPRMVRFDQNTEKRVDPESGLVTTRYYFGSPDGFPLTNPSVDIAFNIPFIKITGGIVGSGMVSSGNLQKQTSEANNRFLITTNLLMAGNYFYIETVGISSLKIVELKMKP